MVSDDNPGGMVDEERPSVRARDGAGLGVNHSLMMGDDGYIEAVEFMGQAMRGDGQQPGWEDTGKVSAAGSPS